MVDDSLLPLKGKKCVISGVSWSGGEGETSFDPDASRNLLAKELSRNLREYGIEVIDDADAAGPPDISIAVHFACLAGDDFGESIAEVKGKILADGKGLPEVSAKVETVAGLAPSQVLKQGLEPAAERLSSQINAALINYYAYGAAPEALSPPGVTAAAPKEVNAPPQGFAERSLARKFDWVPVAVLIVVFFALVGVGLLQWEGDQASRTKKAAAPPATKPSETAPAPKPAGDAQAYFRRGFGHYRKGELDQALADYNRALELDPNLAGAYLDRGIVYSQKGDQDRAVTDYNRALELNPSDAKVYYNRGLAYNRRGDWDQAIADCTRALELNPTYALAYSSRGSSYLKKGDWDRALADYNRALELNPNDVRSLFNKALVFDKAGRRQEALEAYGRFLGSTPKSPSKETRARIEQARKRIKVLEK